MKNDNYLIKKENALAKEPVHKVIDLKKVTFLEENRIELNNKIYSAELGFKSQLLSKIGISNKSISELNKNLNNNEVSDVINKSFLNHFKWKNNLRTTLIGSRESKKLIRLTDKSIIPYNTIFNAIDSIAPKFNNITINASQTDLSFLLNDNKIIETIDLKGENFIPNIGLSYSYGMDFKIAKVMERISCSNQIIIPNKKNKYKDFETSAGIMKELQHLQSDNSNLKYISLIKNLENVNASLKEFKQILTLLYKVTGKNNSYINQFLNKNGVMLFNEKNKPFQEIETNISYWELINSVTDFASNNHLPLKNDEKYFLKEKAFEMLCKKPDFSLN